LGHGALVKSDPRISDTYEIRNDDIVFVDILMPHVNGIQVLEQLARQNVRSAIVLMSGNDQFLQAVEQVAKKLDLRVLGVLYKPFRLLDVKAVLDAA
jgi:YesN/AraC family two-component response regulator